MIGLLIALVGFFGMGTVLLFRRLAESPASHGVSFNGPAIVDKSSHPIFLSQRPHSRGFETGSCGRRAVPQVTGLTMAEAEELLDWLEANDYPPADLTHSADKNFSVNPRLF